MSIEFSKLPFEEAIKFFRQKVNLPTEKWTDIMDGMHTRGFVVAGAMKDGLLTDLRNAIDKAISEGTTLNDFRKSFDETVQRNGWSYKGSRGWRTATILDTNLRTAYAEGHYRQSMAVVKDRPYWRYIGGLSITPRPLHLSWNGLVLHADDPWWDAHYPPKEWGCKCKVVSHSMAELERDGNKIAVKAPDDGTYEWTNPDTGEVKTIPKGVDPGFNYPTGKAAWGQKLSEDAMNAWKAQGEKAWERLTPGDYKTEEMPDKIPIDKSEAVMGKKVSKKEDLRIEIVKVIGADEKAFSFQGGDFRYDILVNAKTLAEHIDPARSEYLPFLPETMTDPYEVWLSFERHKGTGKVVLRQRIIKAIETGKKQGMLVVTNAVNGIMEAWTIVPVEDLEYLNKQRVGKLIWKR